MFLSRTGLRESIARQRWSIAALGVVLVVYLAAFAIMPKDVFWSPDEGIKFIMVETITWDNGLQYRLPYLGASADPEFRFYPSNNPFPDTHNNYPYPLADGSVRFPWPIWFPLLARLPFLVFGIGGVYLLPLLCGLLTSGWAWRVTVHQSPRLAPLAILLVGLGTPTFFYSLTFWEHTTATLLALLAVWIMIRPQCGVRSVILGALLLLAATILRLEMLAFVLAFGIACVITLAATGRLPNLRAIRLSRRSALLGLLAFVVIALFVVNFSAYITPRHQNDIAVYLQVITDNLSRLGSTPGVAARYVNNLPSILVNYTANDGPAMDRIALWLGVVACGLCVLSAFAARLQPILLLPSLVALLALSVAELISRQTYTSLHGILLLAPYMVIAVYALPTAWRRREFPLLFGTLVTCVYFVLGIIMILATRVNWDGSFTTGLEWGPRYLLPLYPLVAIYSLAAVQIYRESPRPRWLKQTIVGIVVVLMMLGVQYQIRGVWMLYHEKQNIATWQTALETHAQGPIVTNMWWLPASLAPFFSSHEMYMAHPQDTNAWLEFLAKRGISTFTFIGASPFEMSFRSSSVRLTEQERVNLPGLIMTRMNLDPAAMGSEVGSR